MEEAMPVLHIKDPVAHELASRIAELTGENLTRTVISALEARWKALANPTRTPAQKYQAVLNLVNEWNCTPVADPRSPDEILYDEAGFPG